MLITFEGPEGSGKSVQSKALATFLKIQGYPVIWTREPGGTDMGHLVRRVLFEFGPELDAWAEAFLFLADRAQHRYQVIEPALEQGHIVICDRYVDSTLAYQGYGRGLDLNRLRELNLLATGGRWPDLTLLLDLDVEIGLQRRKGAGEINQFDTRTLEFHRRVRTGYLEMAAQEPHRWVIISADGPVEEVQKQIRAIVLARLQEIGFSPNRSP